MCNHFYGFGQVFCLFFNERKEWNGKAHIILHTSRLRDVLFHETSVSILQTVFMCVLGIK